MSLMGTLAKVAIGYAAARGVDRLSGGQGLAGLFSGAQIDASKAAASPAPGTEPLQAMMGQMKGQMSGLQDMMADFASKSGMDLSALMGQSAASNPLFSGGQAPGVGMAGLFSAMGGMASMAGKNMGNMIDQFSNMAPNPQADQYAGLLLRAMIQSAKADGKIDASERSKIMDIVGDDADQADIDFVEAQLDADPDPDALAADTPEGMQMQVYSMSLMTIDVDTQGEAKYLDQLAKALGLNQQTVNALHMQMGLKPLYA